MDIKQGLKENWKQFFLLVFVNGLVGGMIGMERSIFPEFAETIFGIKSNVALLSFIVVFGISKAITNYFSGKLANHYGRKKLLVTGWIVALPIPFILVHAHSWNVVLAANCLLGINQGLTWSSTVVMKIDLVGEKNRGLAMGLNEFAGYLAVGIVAYFTEKVASNYGISPYPFYIGIGIAVAGLLISFFFVKDTRGFVHLEKSTTSLAEQEHVFLDTSFKNKTLSAITQAGFVNNLNDGMIWGLLPVFLLFNHFPSSQIAILTAIYPIVWGIGQLFTGKLADMYAKKFLLVTGMLLQGIAIIFFTVNATFSGLFFAEIVVGLGTALVYPTFMAAIADAVHPVQRAESIGVFRLWRDLGYAFGALVSGVFADQFGINYAILFIGLLTVFSGFIVLFRMEKQ